MAQRFCKTPKTLSTSFLADFWRCANNLALMRGALLTPSTLLSLTSSMLTCCCFSCCLAGQGVDDSDPWEEVLAAAPPEVPCYGTEGDLLLAAPNT